MCRQAAGPANIQQIPGITTHSCSVCVWHEDFHRRGCCVAKLQLAAAAKPVVLGINVLHLSISFELRSKHLLACMVETNVLHRLQKFGPRTVAKPCGGTLQQHSNWKPPCTRIRHQHPAPSLARSSTWPQKSKLVAVFVRN